MAAAALGLFWTGQPRAQGASEGAAAELGTEAGNWGLVPFSAVPVIQLGEQDRAAIRALEDRQLQERRALEDRYEAEFKALMRQQAEEREALRTQIIEHIQATIAQ
jgi:hypothetical protein